MKKPYSIALLLLVFSFGCGGGQVSKTLTLSPSGSTQMFINSETNTYSFIYITAMFSDGTAPTSMTWNSSAACVPLTYPGTTDTPQTYSNVADLYCSPSCSGTTNAVITANSEGLTASIPVSCAVY
jgi:hypothetical protein